MAAVEAPQRSFLQRFYPLTPEEYEMSAFDQVLVEQWKEHGRDEGYTLLEFALDCGFAERNGGKFLRDVDVHVCVNDRKLCLTVDPQDQHWYGRLRQDIARGIDKSDRAQSIGLFFDDGIRLKGSSADLERLLKSPAYSLGARVVQDGEPISVPARPTYELPLKSWNEVEQEATRILSSGGSTSSPESSTGAQVDSEDVSKIVKQLIALLRDRLVKRLPKDLAAIPAEERDAQRIQELVLAHLFSPDLYGGAEAQKTFWASTKCSDMGAAITEISGDLACRLVEVDLGASATPELHTKTLIGCSIWDDLRKRFRRQICRRRPYRPCPSSVAAVVEEQIDVYPACDIADPIGSPVRGSLATDIDSQLIAMSRQDPYTSSDSLASVAPIAHRCGKKNRKHKNKKHGGGRCSDDEYTSDDDQPTHESISCAKRHACYQRRRNYQLDVNSTVCMLPSYERCVTLKSSGSCKKLHKKRCDKEETITQSISLVRAEPHQLSTGVPLVVEAGASLNADAPPTAELVGDLIWTEDQALAFQDWETRYGHYVVTDPLYRPPPPGYYRGWHRGWRRWRRHHPRHRSPRYYRDRSPRYYSPPRRPFPGVYIRDGIESTEPIQRGRSSSRGGSPRSRSSSRGSRSPSPRGALRSPSPRRSAFGTGAAPMYAGPSVAGAANPSLSGGPANPTGNQTALSTINAKVSDTSIRGINLMEPVAEVGKCITCAAPLAPGVQASECPVCGGKKKKQAPPPTAAVKQDIQVPAVATVATSQHIGGPMPEPGKAKIRVIYEASDNVDIDFKLRLSGNTEISALHISGDQKNEYVTVPVNSYHVVITDKESGKQLAEAMLNSMAQRNAYTLRFKQDSANIQFSTDLRFEEEKRALASKVLSGNAVRKLLAEGFQGVLLAPSNEAFERSADGKSTLDDYVFDYPSGDFGALFLPKDGKKTELVTRSGRRYRFNPNNTWIWKAGAEHMNVLAIVPVSNDNKKVMLVVFDGTAQDVPAQ